MRYMMLVYGQELSFEDVPPEVLEESLARFTAFHTEMAERGAMLAAERLQSSATATTVRVRDGQVHTTDGPFAESKEQIGGIYIFEAPDLDAALEIAAKNPASETGAIEVRPIMEAPVEEQLLGENS